MTVRRFTVMRVEGLLPCLLDALELNRRAVKNLLKFGAVTVNGEAVRQFDHLLAVGDAVVILDVRTAAADQELTRAGIQIMYEDDSLLVLDKPAGLLTVATTNEKSDTLFFRLNQYLRNRDGAEPERPRVVHRIDQETSGLVLFAKSDLVKRSLQAGWPAVTKTYLAAVTGTPDPAEGTITTYLTETKALQVFSNDHQTPGGQLAITHYRLVRTAEAFSLVELRLGTGRKHQIRVHLAGRGCPVVGDKRYGAKSNCCGRLALHATRLALDHPLTGIPLHFHSPLPAAISRLFPRLS